MIFVVENTRTVVSRCQGLFFRRIGVSGPQIHHHLAILADGKRSANLVAVFEVFRENILQVLESGITGAVDFDWSHGIAIW